MHKFTEFTQDLDKAVFKVNATINKLEDNAQCLEENIARWLSPWKLYKSALNEGDG